MCRAGVSPFADGIYSSSWMSHWTGTVTLSLGFANPVLVFDVNLFFNATVGAASKVAVRFKTDTGFIVRNFATNCTLVR
jgi:hypothetical protein